MRDTVIKLPWKKEPKQPEQTTEDPIQEQESRQLGVSKFITKPRTIQAVKWDGSPEGASEVKTLLEGNGYTMCGYQIVYDGDGKLDKRESRIKYYLNRTAAENPPEEGSYRWKSYNLMDGWIVVETSGSSPKNVSAEQFNRDYMELYSVSYDTFIEWIGDDQSA